MPADEGGDGDGHEDGRDGSSSNSSSSSSITSSDQSSSSNSSGDGSGSGSSADWSTVVKTKAKLPKPIINTQSLSLASFASEASLVSRLFHGVLRQEMIYKMTRRPSVTFERFHCLMLQIATSSIATETNRVTKGNRGPSSRNTPKTAGKAPIRTCPHPTHTHSHTLNHTPTPPPFTCSGDTAAIAKQSLR